jgi:phosphoribosylformimino-5-aminoimidazole carboxamide ribotide isomerase
MDRATVFNEDPAAQARDFAAAGAGWIHVVDLDGAFAGKPKNAGAVETILAALKGGAVKLQLGGGIRDAGAIEGWLDKGVSRIVLGTVAVKNPNLVREACRRWSGRVALGIDARGGKVAVEGWAETSSVTALDLGRKFEDAGAAAIIYTDIARDGMLGGANVKATAELAKQLKTPVIASGGVASIKDLEALKAAGIPGAIIGRALYDGRIDLKAALALAGA